MKLLYTISPDYLGAVLSESQHYSFYIQGYPSIKEAQKGLYKRNISDILGFLYLTETKPNIKKLANLIMEIDSFANQDMIFLLAIKTYDFATLKANINPQNLKIKVLSGWELITDLVLKECFTPFILSNFAPYEDTSLGDTSIYHYTVNLSEYRTKNLEYSRLFDYKSLQLLSPVNKLDSVEETYLHDKILAGLSGVRDDYYDVRKAYIAAHFGINEIDKVANSLLVVMKGNKTLARALEKRMEEKINEVR